MTVKRNNRLNRRGAEQKVAVVALRQLARVQRAVWLKHSIVANVWASPDVPLDAARLVAARQVLPSNDRRAVVAEAGELFGRG